MLTVQRGTQLSSVVVFSCSERYLLAGAEGGNVSVWRVSSGELVHCLKGKAGGGGTSGRVNSIAVSVNSKVITSYSNG